jgi:hypothetical protein
VDDLRCRDLVNPRIPVEKLTMAKGSCEPRLSTKAAKPTQRAMAVVIERRFLMAHELHARVLCPMLRQSLAL